MQPIVLIAVLVVGIMFVVAVLRWRRATISGPTPPAPPVVRSPSQTVSLPSDLEAEAQALLMQGKKIEAIKLVRQHTQLGLKEAKGCVEALSTGASFSYTLPQAMETRQPAALSSAVQDEVWALLARGKKIEAIKLVREHSGWGLKEAKDYVEALPSRAAPPAFFKDAEVDRAGGLAPDVEAEAYNLARQGKKIEAIKLVRQHTGWGLKEAKDYVDRLA